MHKSITSCNKESFLPSETDPGWVWARFGDRLFGLAIDSWASTARDPQDLARAAHGIGAQGGLEPRDIPGGN